jgi:hypothetical protein
MFLNRFDVLILKIILYFLYFNVFLREKHFNSQPVPPQQSQTHFISVNIHSPHIKN